MKVVNVFVLVPERAAGTADMRFEGHHFDAVEPSMVSGFEEDPVGHVVFDRVAEVAAEIEVLGAKSGDVVVHFTG